MTFDAEERDIILGALDLAAKHLGAQLQQVGLQAAGDAAGRISAVSALAIKISQHEPLRLVEDDAA